MGRCAGAFAEYALMDAREAIAMPPGLSWEEAAAVPLTFMTAHDMLIAQGKLAAGEWLLVTGISSGVGVAALKTAKVLGARVIGTSGSAEKLEKLKVLGLDVGLRTRSADFCDAVMQATGGRGANLVVNNVGGSVFAECVRALAFEATVGHMGGVMKAEIDIDALHAKRLTLFGVSNKLRNAEQRAALYCVTTRRFNEVVRRNLTRFPQDFMFQPTNEGHAALRSLFAISNIGRGGRRATAKPPKWPPAEGGRRRRARAAKCARGCP